GEEVNYAASADDEMIEAGFEYFDGPSRRDGEATGYIPIYVETTGDTLQGAYVRPEMKILGEDETVPEFRGELETPAACPGPRLSAPPSRCRCGGALGCAGAAGGCSQHRGEEALQAIGLGVVDDLLGGAAL